MVCALAESARNQASAHPLWHYLVVAGVAVGVFLGIKVKEYREQRRERAVSPGFAVPTVGTTVLATASFLAGGIHLAVTGEHFREAFIFGLFFLGSAAAQVAWAVLLLHRPTRTLLWVGAIGNAAVIALWTMTRTVGLPIGPEPWHPEAIGVLDVVSTLFEVVIVVTAVAVLVRRAPRARDAVVERRPEELRREHPNLLRPSGERTTAVQRT